MINEPEVDHVTIRRDVLETLTRFADSHGGEYGSNRLYFALIEANQALGRERLEPQWWLDEDSIGPTENPFEEKNE